ncbi:polyketide synthase [Paucibacter sp. APW11]|uniref:Polyketide synthase n=1 Tax=Roseateles aquae TaxID=3077235 RepID=A0ABU3P584_9BURK|nr:polyketide synthase [Paucibacter sp. APW11]MDT8997738.1 polyketide synthase [Paucibacter sp. APW11]
MNHTDSTALPRGWAITGLACRYPGIESTEQLRSRLFDPAAPSPALAADERNRLPPPRASYADFGIPPIYRASINRVQLDVLDAARAALMQAGLAQGGIDAEHTDVVFVTAFGLNRCHENEARMLGVELAAAYAEGLPEQDQQRFVAHAKLKLDHAFAASSHDKVGEMASTVAARIAACFKLRGRAIALEAQDVGGVEALLTALDALSQARARAVLVVGAQRLESALLRQTLARHLDADRLAQLSEGCCALVLQGGDVQPQRVLARLADVRLSSLQSWQQLVSGWGAAADSHEETAYWALGGQLDVAQIRPLVRANDGVSSQLGICGYGHAIEALSTLAHAVLAQQQRPTHRVRVIGAGLAGQAYAMRLLPANAGAAVAAVQQAPVAVIGAGAWFGPARGLQQYWQQLQSAQAQFRALDAERFRPALFASSEETAPLSYYIQSASFTEAAQRQGRSADPAALPLALAVAQEAFDAVKTAPPWASNQELLVLVATNLTLDVERRLAALELQPRIEAVLQSLGQEWKLGEAQQEAGMQAMRRAALAYGRGDDGAPLQLADDALARLPASGMAARIAKTLGLDHARGLAIEAACAGSLAAIELAMLSLRSGRAAAALVIGVELPVNVHDLCLCAAQRMLAPGVIATFTDQATGFTPGDGAGAVLLTLQSSAEQEAQPMLAALRAIASCTESKSIIAPNTAGQVSSMQRAFAQVDHPPAAISYVETHGTGTLIGDEVEIESLAAVYGASARLQPLRLGALKSSFGHCFAAAGMASVVKTLLALQHERLPANHFAHPLKAELGFEQRGFDPLQQPCEWPRHADLPRRAAVNAFGTGGINVHLLIDDCCL